MSIPSEVRRLLDEGSPRIAVVGATDNPAKYGNRIYRDLVAKGFAVIGVNPNRPEACGRPCYPTVSDVPEPVDIVDFVVPPAVAREVVEAIEPGRAAVAWFQPGAFDSAVVAAARARFRHVIAGPCIMVET